MSPVAIKISEPTCSNQKNIFHLVKKILLNDRYDRAGKFSSVYFMNATTDEDKTQKQKTRSIPLLATQKISTHFQASDLIPIVSSLIYLFPLTNQQCLSRLTNPISTNNLLTHI